MTTFDYSNAVKDVPHWARRAVDKVRKQHNISYAVSDRNIYARMQYIGRLTIPFSQIADFMRTGKYSDNEKPVAWIIRMRDSETAINFTRSETYANSSSEYHEVVPVGLTENGKPLAWWITDATGFTDTIALSNTEAIQRTLQKFNVQPLYPIDKLEWKAVPDATPSTERFIQLLGRGVRKSIDDSTRLIRDKFPRYEHDADTVYYTPAVAYAIMTDDNRQIDTYTASVSIMLKAVENKKKIVPLSTIPNGEIVGYLYERKHREPLIMRNPLYGSKPLYELEPSDVIRTTVLPPDAFKVTYSVSLDTNGYAVGIDTAKPTINTITRDDVNWFRECRENKHHQNNLDVYQTLATKSAIYPGKGTPLGLAYVALKLNGEAGEFAEHTGKAMRDDALLKPISDDSCEQLMAPSGFISGELTPERRTAIIKEVGDVLWYLSAACTELGIKLSEAAQTNLEKLCDRGERGKLQGSGDDR